MKEGDDVMYLTKKYQSLQTSIFGCLYSRLGDRAP